MGSLRVRGCRGALQLRRTGASTHADMRARSHNSQDHRPTGPWGGRSHTSAQVPRLVRECVSRDPARAWTYNASCPRGLCRQTPGRVRPAAWWVSSPRALTLGDPPPRPRTAAGVAGVAGVSRAGATLNGNGPSCMPSRHEKIFLAT